MHKFKLELDISYFMPFGKDTNLKRSLKQTINYEFDNLESTSVLI